MSTRARLQNANDSKSLWNYTLSPGWSKFDAHILRLAVMHYGCGAWKAIGRHFPKKTCGQLNLQTQRLFGQQALAEFQKLHIDPINIKKVNDQIDGFRKNTCLINTGNNMTVKQREEKKLNHKNLNGIPKDIYEQITIPVVLDIPQKSDNVVDDIQKLREMYRVVYDIQLRLKHLEDVANGKYPVKNGKSRSKSKSKPVVKRNNNNNSNGNGTCNKKQNDEKKNEEIDNDGDVQMDNDNTNNVRKEPPALEKNGGNHVNNNNMDDDVALALALSVSMDVHTPAIEKKTKSKKKSSKKKKSAKKKKASAKKKKSSNRKSKKRKTMDGDDEPYVPPAKKIKRS